MGCDVSVMQSTKAPIFLFANYARVSHKSTEQTRFPIGFGSSFGDSCPPFVRDNTQYHDEGPHSATQHPVGGPYYPDSYGFTLRSPAKNYSGMAANLSEKVHVTCAGVAEASLVASMSVSECITALARRYPSLPLVLHLALLHPALVLSLHGGPVGCHGFVAPLLNLGFDGEDRWLGGRPSLAAGRRGPRFHGLRRRKAHAVVYSVEHFEEGGPEKGARPPDASQPPPVPAFRGSRRPTPPSVHAGIRVASCSLGGRATALVPPWTGWGLGRGWVGGESRLVGSSTS